MRKLTEEQRLCLFEKRSTVMGLLLAVGDFCPGCMKDIDEHDAEFHHVPWRQSDSYSFEQDLLLLDVRNGVLAHHACHMAEGWDFQVRASLLIWHRVGPDTLRRFRQSLEQKGVTLRDWPVAMQSVMATMARQSSVQFCPFCHAFHLHEFRNPPGKIGAPIMCTGRLTVRAICWSCLRIFPVGTRFTGGTHV